MAKRRTIRKTKAISRAASGWVDYGDLFRKLREERGLTLRAVARGAGVSPGVVSKFERGQVSPTFITAHRLLSILGLSLAEFFGATLPGLPKRAPAVFPAKGVKTVSSGGETWTWLLPVDAHFPCQMFHEEWQPGTVRTQSETLMGDLVGYVLEGELTLFVPGKRGKGWQELLVRRGESFYIPAGVPHRSGNRGQVVTRFIDMVLGAGKAAY